MLDNYRLQLDFETSSTGEIQLYRTKFSDHTRHKESRAGADGFRWVVGTKSLCWLLLRYKIGSLQEHKKEFSDVASTTDGQCVDTLINCVKKKQEKWVQHIFQINHEASDSLNLILEHDAKVGQCWLSPDLAPGDIAFRVNGAELNTAAAHRDLMNQITQQLDHGPSNSQPLRWRPRQHTPPMHNDSPTDTSDPVFVLPYVARGIVGRDDDVHIVLRQMNPGPRLRPNSEQGLLVVQGVPGVGKSALTQVIARDERVRRQFPHGVLWGAASEENTDHESILSGWYRVVSGSEVCPSDPVQMQTTLCGMLQHRRVLIIIDDLWKSDELNLLQVGGALSRTLVTTRSPQVARDLAPLTESRYELRPLGIDDSITLLCSVSDGAIDETTQGVRKLVQALEGLPLLLQVSGRVIQRADLLGQDIHNLIENLADDLSRLFDEKPPGMAQRTVEAVVRRSTDRLSAEQRYYFGCLGTLANKPATFSSDILRTAWDCPDPDSILESLVEMGLVEVAGPNRYQMHALIAEYARSLSNRH